jgi:hypothetical protein
MFADSLSVTSIFFFFKFYNTNGVEFSKRYLQDSNDGASNTSTGVARLLRVWVFGAAQVIFAFVQNDGTANDAARADQGDHGVGEAGENYTVSVGHNVAQVADVTHMVFGCAMGQLERRIRT